MNVRALLRPLRGLWPQKVRTRLTLIYAALFFAAGSALLGLTYGLVASNLPTQPALVPDDQQPGAEPPERVQSAGAAFKNGDRPRPLSRRTCSGASRQRPPTTPAPPRACRRSASKRWPSC